MSVCPEGCSSKYCLHPNCILALTGFNLGLGHLIERCLVVQAYPFAADVCLSLGALFCLVIITTWPLRPVIVLHGVQHTTFCFPTPTGREGTY